MTELRTMFRRIWCVLAHSKHQKWKPGGIHCWDVYCAKCDRWFVSFDD